MDDYWEQWSAGYTHFKKDRPKPDDSRSSAYKDGYEAAEIQKGVMYALEQVDTARSLHNGH